MLGYIILLIIVIVALALPILLVLAIIQFVVNRKDTDMREEAEAHRKILENTYDRIWNEIKTRSGLTEEHRRSFNNIYPSLIDKSIDDDTMLDWILENNINFDPSEYATMMESIEEDRQKFVSHQHRMMHLIKDHRRMHQKKLIGKLLKNKSAIIYTPVDINYERWGEGRL